jgi:hypothetical protein
MAARPQTYVNHARVVPGYHMVTFGLIVVSVLWSAWRTVTALSADHLIVLLLSVAAVLLFFYARIFALTVQDRVIRLEMRLRLAQLLPPDLRPRVPELTVKQLIALRFASDDELPDLVHKVLTDHIEDQKAIKRMIRQWQADYLRA